jgi:hypothetical protein
MTFWAAFRQSYALAWRFMLALPILAAVAIGFEGLQHVVEYSSGMYVSSARMHAEANDPARMIAGVLKVGWLLILQYWVTRFAVSGSAKTTLARDAIAIRKFAWFFAFSAVIELVLLFLPGVLSDAGVARRWSAVSGLILAIATLPLGPFLIPWAVGAALGDPRASPMFSFRRTPGSILWAIALGVATSLPILIVHYAFGYGAVGRSPAFTVGLLSVDAVLVSFMGVVFITSQVLIAERMAGRAGDRLSCGPFEHGDGSNSPGSPPV